MMADTATLHLSLCSIWDYLRLSSTQMDFGPYPQRKVVIGGQVSPEPSGDTIGIARLDALAACATWAWFGEGERGALNDPKLGRVVASLGYLIGRQVSVMDTQAIHFGYWLAYAITGWSVGSGPETMLTYLDSVAIQATSMPAGSVCCAWDYGQFWTRYYPAAVKGVLLAIGGEERNKALAWIG
ncbi:MAG: hypothetical protein O7G88_14185 [bacterium]|nr:hypothetical protein [bacterium]